MILERLIEVERRHLRRESNRAIARALQVDEGTIRQDLVRVAELMRERAGTDIEDARAEVIAELDDTARLALEAYAWDLAIERAVLFGEPVQDGDQALHVHYDDDGRAQFRGNKVGALQARRQAVMDKAKVRGLVVEKQEQAGEVLVRIYERVVEPADADPR